MNRKQRSVLRKELRLTGTTFIYVGRLLKIKGLFYLLDAFKKVQTQSQSEVSLIIVGDGVDQDSFRHKCDSEDIRNVVFTGFRQKSELPKLYAVADVFVFPTLGDPYGLVVDEAMACMLPIISTSAAGEIRDRVKNGTNGYIVPPGNSSALATAMLKLVKEPNLRKCMGAVSAERIKGNTSEKWADDFVRIVFNLLDRS